MRLQHAQQTIERLAIDLGGIQTQFLRVRAVDANRSLPITAVTIDSVDDVQRRRRRPCAKPTTRSTPCTRCATATERHAPQRCHMRRCWPMALPTASPMAWSLLRSVKTGGAPQG